MDSCLPKFKQLTLDALQELASALKEPDESIPEVSGTTANTRRTYLDYISARLLPRLDECSDGRLTGKRDSSQPVLNSDSYNLRTGRSQTTNRSDNLRTASSSSTFGSGRSLGEVDSAPSPPAIT